MNNTTVPTFNSTLPEHPKASEIRRQIECIILDVFRVVWKEPNISDIDRAQHIQNRLLYQLTNTFLDWERQPHPTAQVVLDLKSLKPVYHIRAEAYGVTATATFFWGERNGPK